MVILSLLHMCLQVVLENTSEGESRGKADYGRKKHWDESNMKPMLQRNALA